MNKEDQFLLSWLILFEFVCFSELDRSCKILVEFKLLVKQLSLKLHNFCKLENEK